MFYYVEKSLTLKGNFLLIQSKQTHSEVWLMKPWECMHVKSFLDVSQCTYSLINHEKFYVYLRMPKIVGFP